MKGGREDTHHPHMSVPRTTPRCTSSEGRQPPHTSSPSVSPRRWGQQMGQPHCFLSPPKRTSAVDGTYAQPATPDKAGTRANPNSRHRTTNRVYPNVRARARAPCSTTPQQLPPHPRSTTAPSQVNACDRDRAHRPRCCLPRPVCAPGVHSSQPHTPTTASCIPTGVPCPVATALDTIFPSPPSTLNVTTTHLVKLEQHHVLGLHVEHVRFDHLIHDFLQGQADLRIAVVLEEGHGDNWGGAKRAGGGCGKRKKWGQGEVGGRRSDRSRMRSAQHACGGGAASSMGEKRASARRWKDPQ